MIIPREIREKIEIRNRLDNEIQKWCENNLDLEGMHSSTAYITDAPTGEEQIEAEEWCDQVILGEDWYRGNYYWKMDNGKFLCMPFEI